MKLKKENARVLLFSMTNQDGKTIYRDTLIKF
jgi:hypothetical protein